MIRESRLRRLNAHPIDPAKPFVLYWMQQSQRAHFNHALEYAIEQANALGKPVVVAFGLMDDYPEATERHYAFMLEGLADVATQLRERGILFVMRKGQPKDVAVQLGRDAALVVTDRAYLRHLNQWRSHVAESVGVSMVQVETDVVVPVNVASDKNETAARTLRPKIHRAWAEYMIDLPAAAVKKSSLGLKIASDFDPADVDKNLASIRCDRAVKRSTHFKGGAIEAQRRLDEFVKSRLNNYAEGRNEPADGHTSQLSPYLQYGHLSPIDLALRVSKARQGQQPDRDSYIEELIVRRELSHNFTTFCDRYDQYESLPGWARASLAKHAGDKREYVYTRDQLATAQTHDPYWNAAQTEMVHTGFMHNYMRMYWGKKILEWSATPQDAFATTLYLNNRFLLDGLNSNSYGNVGWIFGLHDRPWTERSIFGVVRYMNAAGLERKFFIDRYVNKIDAIARGGKRVADSLF
jgi:deoxyribodipyrimidine photo-lyase